MSKRSSFLKIDKDKYRTPHKAVIPLLPQLPAGTQFAEPCAGNGILIDHLTAAGHQCVWAGDIDPERDDVKLSDAMHLTEIKADMVITNLPWTRANMHPLVDHLSAMLPCWFLFDADWAFTKQSANLIHRCSKIVPVGRVKWIPDSKYSGLDSCAWYEFRPGHTIGPRFVGYQEARGAVLPIRAPRLPPAPENAPRPPAGPSAIDLLARLRGKMRRMNIPKLNAEKFQ